VDLAPRVSFRVGADPAPAGDRVAAREGRLGVRRRACRGARALGRAGFHVLRLDLRGAGDGVRTAPSLYHAGLTRDLSTAVEWLAELPGGRVTGVFVVGFSLGGHIALRWAGELAGSPPSALRGVAALSAPLDLERTTQAMERLRSTVYHQYIARNLQRQGHAFARLHPDRVHYTEAELAKVRTIRQYDSLVIAPMHGFRSAEEYYAQASAHPWLAHIRVPTVVIHAEDDPMVPASLVRPYLEGMPVTQEWSMTGGHVGWFTGFGEDACLRTWGIERVLRFIAPLTEAEHKAG
jgi:predicted alpha/beta-fold hydrolase